MTESPGETRGRVLIIVENLPVPFDRRVWMEATTLHANGYAVSVICPTAEDSDLLYEELNGVHIYRHRLPPEHSSALGYFREYAAGLWSEWRLAGRVRRERGFTLIHACNPPDLLFLVALWFRVVHGVRFLFDHHDLCPELYESKFDRRGVYHWMMRLAERCTFGLAHTVISTNTSYRDVAVQRGRKDPGDVFVVRSGPDLSLFQPTKGDPAYRRGRTFLVGYLGVMGEFDGVDHLVRAADELVHRIGRTDIHFCLIGSGPMLDSLKVLARELQVDDYVEFTGRISDEHMIDRLSSCDIGVNPDPLNPLNDKSTMNKVLEYMALRLPIVQYDLTEGRRSAGEASWYARPNDIPDFAARIASLLDDPEARERMGRVGRRRMEEELEWRHQIPHLLEAYRHAFESDRNR